MLLLGNSLAGKTRTVVEYIKEVQKESPNTILYIPDFKITYKRKNFLKTLNSLSPQLAVLDDIDKFFETEDGDTLIEELVKRNIRIIATCKSGPEYRRFKEKSSMGVQEIFGENNIIVFERETFTKDELNILADKFKVNLEASDYDGNIGSLLLPITTMRSRYFELKNSQSQTELLSINILKSLKALSFSSNFFRKGMYEVNKVEDYCLKLALKEFGEFKIRNIGVFENVQKDMIKEKTKNFLNHKEKALKILESDKFNLNFIKRTGKYIEVEEVYLEKILDLDYKRFEVRKDIFDFYTQEERFKNGYFAKAYDFNKKIKEKNNYDFAFKQYKKMKKYEIKPNQKTYLLLIQLSENFTKSKEWFNIAKRQDRVTVGSFGELLKKCSSSKVIIEINY